MYLFWPYVQETSVTYGHIHIHRYFTNNEKRSKSSNSSSAYFQHIYYEWLLALLSMHTVMWNRSPSVVIVIGSTRMWPQYISGYKENKLLLSLNCAVVTKHTLDYGHSLHYHNGYHQYTTVWNTSSLHAKHIHAEPGFKCTKQTILLCICHSYSSTIWALLNGVLHGITSKLSFQPHSDVDEPITNIQ